MNLSTNAADHARAHGGCRSWKRDICSLGIYSTMILNVSDYDREHKHGTGPDWLDRPSIRMSNPALATLFMGPDWIYGFGANAVVAEPDSVFRQTQSTTTPLLMTTLLFSPFCQVQPPTC